MTALFDEPVRVSISPDSPWALGRTGLLLGFHDAGSGSGLHGIVCHEDGNVNVMPLSDFRLDWRYDVEKDTWVDETAQRAGESAQTELETDQSG